MGFENVFRPFQTVRNTPPQKVFSQGEQDQPLVTLAVGKGGGGGTQLSGSFSSTTTVYQSKHAVERSLQQSSLGIGNPGFPSIFPGAD
jgi:hypothetical protein